MARSAAKRRPKPSQTKAGPRRTPPPPRQPSPEDLMFFPRLRRQAKWMFVFLALVFLVGFVAFGVGSSLPSGFADVLQGSSSSGNQSVGDARDDVEKNPKDADAQLELARAYQREGRSDEAIAPLEAYLKIRPRDENVLQELAGLYTGSAGRARDEALAAQAEVQQLSGASAFTSGTLAKALEPGPFEELKLNDANTRFNDAVTRGSEAYMAATRTYERLVVLVPRDPQLWYLLALSAEPAGDTKKALEGYRKFLELAPDANEAIYVREKVKQLEASQEPASQVAGR
ncbi:MAG: tetratricopeptide repeat protein [Gaiellaceae bacterium]